MSDVTSDEVFDRVLRCLQQNGERFKKERRAAQIRRYWRIIMPVAIFGAGFVTGYVVR